MVLHALQRYERQFKYAKWKNVKERTKAEHTNTWADNTTNNNQIANLIKLEIYKMWNGRATDGI